MTAKPFFFLHLPRTAGTTLNAILRDSFGREEILSVYSEQEYREFREIEAARLDGIRLIQGHLFLEEYDPPRIYSRDVSVFTFLREPVSRLVSEYLFLKSWPENHMYSYLNENKVSFREYLASVEPRLVFRGKNFMTRFYTGLHFDVNVFPAEALEVAKHNLEHVFGFVGIQERFDESLLLLGDFLGLKSLCYEKRNVLAAEKREAVSDDDIALARELNAADVELYAFARTLFENRIASLGRLFALKVREFELINTKYQKMCSAISTELVGEQNGPIILPK
ncbi:sulfotransferase family 2 domain-containing protein [Desulfovibrio mangrovi]|uniref:sulfotransferase family 2 domain-containing protein n=1 Tax=Desulfovibrio mangrovi TaxID=2976983 RepID=UPI0022463949|nr:sulfotransferase family 2 domain-containing protein [Desulfovibrio mangrovi]UZP67511.1 sulfotransferase family 2 domain-containing protein [Desulfovibrio mangrovi]